MERVNQVSPLTMGWCLQCHREHAKLPVGDFQRAALSLTQKTKAYGRFGLCKLPLLKTVS